jgi:hypothetical protein
MCLLLETGQTVKARAATLLPYQMTPDARKRILLFAPSYFFINARVIHRTTSNFDNKGVFVIEAAEFSVRDAHHSPSTEHMRERVEVLWILYEASTMQLTAGVSLSWYRKFEGFTALALNFVFFPKISIQTWTIWRLVRSWTVFRIVAENFEYFEGLSMDFQIR